MRRIIVPLVFVILVALGSVLPVYASPSDVVGHPAKACGFE